MAKVQPKDYLIGMVIFTLFIMGTVSLITLFRNNDVTYTDTALFNNFNATFNTKTRLDNSVNSLRESILAQDTPALVDFIATMFLTAYQSLLGLFTSISFMNDVFYGLNTVFGVPIWIPSLIISIVTIMIVFSIISALLQRDL